MFRNHLCVANERSLKTAIFAIAMMAPEFDLLTRKSFAGRMNVYTLELRLFT